MNDSLRTDVFLRYHPETVASACIYLTARKLKIALPKSPAWWSVFDVSERDIKDVCFRILRLYERPKVRRYLLFNFPSHVSIMTIILSLSWYSFSLMLRNWTNAWKY